MRHPPKDRCGASRLLIDLRKLKLASWTRKHIRQAQIVALIFAMLPQSLAGDHDRHRRFRDKIIAERTKQNTMSVSEIRK